ncbi:PREDICTED: uncharacterized protein LOC104722520 [Camelina sativa]|uniref:Uncharacterized protein LOC104722520 n=1 Tax=Camelina sativa TaxID=90675 RepID=A0ABM0UC62_CAMSA|nr:PREDICTED: uncharacterized protein LOC104722520 [Camelina sativa]
MSIFPFGIRGAVRETLLVWVIDDDYSFPESLVDPWQIKSAFMKDPFKVGMLPIWIFGAAENTWLNEMEDKLWEAGILVHLYKGDNRTRLNRVMADLAFWAFRLHAPTDLVIVSEREDMEQDPKFCSFRRAIKNNRVNAYAEHIRSFLNNDYPSRFPPALEEQSRRGYSPIAYYGYESDNKTLKLAYATYDETSEACGFPKIPACPTTARTREEIEKYPPTFRVPTTARTREEIEKYPPTFRVAGRPN